MSDRRMGRREAAIHPHSIRWDLMNKLEVLLDPDADNNWKMLADWLGFYPSYIKYMEVHQKWTRALLHDIYPSKKENPSVQEIIIALHEIERYDARDLLLDAFPEIDLGYLEEYGPPNCRSNDQLKHAEQNEEACLSDCSQFNSDEPSDRQSYRREPEECYLSFDERTMEQAMELGQNGNWIRSLKHGNHCQPLCNTYEPMETATQCPVVTSTDDDTYSGGIEYIVDGPYMQEPLDLRSQTHRSNNGFFKNGNSFNYNDSSMQYDDLVQAVSPEQQSILPSDVHNRGYHSDPIPSDACIRGRPVHYVYAPPSPQNSGAILDNVPKDLRMRGIINHIPSDIRIGGIPVRPNFSNIQNPVNISRVLSEEMSAQNLQRKAQQLNNTWPKSKVEEAKKLPNTGMRHNKSADSVIQLSPHAKADREVRVFITYTYDNDEYVKRVLSCGRCLKDNKFQVSVDAFEAKLISNTQQDSDWHNKRYETANFILVAISKGYRQAVEATNHTSISHGATHAEHIYHRMMQDVHLKQRIILLMFRKADDSHIPRQLLRMNPPKFHWPSQWKDVLYYMLKPQTIISNCSRSQSQSLPGSTTGQQVCSGNHPAVRGFKNGGHVVVNGVQINNSQAVNTGGRVFRAVPVVVRGVKGSQTLEAAIMQPSAKRHQDDNPRGGIKKTYLDDAIGVTRTHAGVHRSNSADPKCSLFIQKNICA